MTPGEELTLYFPSLAGELPVGKLSLPTEGTRSRQSELVLQRVQGGNLWAASLGIPHLLAANDAANATFLPTALGRNDDFVLALLLLGRDVQYLPKVV
jgi:hypothetical protein